MESGTKAARLELVEEPVGELLLRRQWVNYKDVLLKLCLSLATSLTVLTTCTIVLLIGKEAFAFFHMVSIVDFLLGTQWQPLIEPQQYGVLPLVVGSTLVVVLSMGIALPLGVFVAAYLSEYASFPIRSVVKPFLEILAGIPTVVYGYFALTFVTPQLQQLFPAMEVFNAASAGIVVGIMILPMVSSLCDDAFCAVAPELKEAGYSLGATSYEVFRGIVLPASAFRLAAAVILAVSRALGETMAVTLAAGATPNMEWSFLKSIQTMTAYIVEVSLGDTPAGGVAYLTCYGVAALLFGITFVLNVLGYRWMRRTAE
ncbi:MAG: phosphate ABC transporter permease subunit PstC [Zetaproteobacteria bacterium]|nr:phosphate ABC transporter permease subunit PstC [Zetaproteobacteria bacterium]